MYCGIEPVPKASFQDEEDAVDQRKRYERTHGEPYVLSVEPYGVHVASVAFCCMVFYVIKIFDKHFRLFYLVDDLGRGMFQRFFHSTTNSGFEVSKVPERDTNN